MPAVIGFPAYLASKSAQFYERAGTAKSLGSPDKSGILSIAGTASTPCGDFSDPINTLYNLQVFWGFDKKLPLRTYFLSVNWHTSYSIYENNYVNCFNNFDPELTNNIKAILQDEEELTKVVQLVCKDSLYELKSLILEIVKIIK